jgi:hypothetical protein
MLTNELPTAANLPPGQSPRRIARHNSSFDVTHEPALVYVGRRRRDAAVAIKENIARHRATISADERVQNDAAWR